MEISGQRLSLPRNFFFLNRLPARFEILVVARGATLPKGTAFELEITGQRLVLHSKVDLKVGARYELEKISALEFKILSEKSEEISPTVSEPRPGRAAMKEEREAVGFLVPENSATYADILALKVLKDSGKTIASRSGKYAFDFEAEYALSGVFVPHGDGRYQLFISGPKNYAANLASVLEGLGIDAVRHVTPQVLERIGVGAVDLQS